jgi:protein SCO1/2
MARRALVATLVAALATSAVGSSVAVALPQSGPPKDYDGDATVAPAALRDIGFDQNLGGDLPLDLVLKDETGRDVRLGELFRGRPVVLSLVYYECPMLCTLVLNGVVSALKPVALEPGKDYDVIAVSFDDRETPALAAAKKKVYLDRFGKPGAEAAWSFLTGDRAAIERLTKAVGFRYAWDEETKQFAHPSGIVVATPQGKIARYLFGVEYAPKDVRLALVEASEGKVGGFADQVLLFCYKYDPTRGRYSAAVINLVRAGALLTVVSLVTFIGVSRRRERRVPPTDPRGNEEV